MVVLGDFVGDEILPSSLGIYFINHDIRIPIKKTTRIQWKVRLTCLKFNKHTRLGIANSVPPLFSVQPSRIFVIQWLACVGDPVWRRRHRCSGGGGRSGGTSLCWHVLKQGQICQKKYAYEKAIPWHSIKNVSHSDIS